MGNIGGCTGIYECEWPAYPAACGLEVEITEEAKGGFEMSLLYNIAERR